MTATSAPAAISSAAYANETPMTNLLLSLLDRAGVRTDTLGDSSGPLEGLSDV